jgi:hypothetical protein
MEEILDNLRSYIARRVNEGFDSRDAIVDQVKDYAQDEYQRDDLDPQIEQITAELIEEHRLAERQWPSTTDCDRLDHAFEAMEESGLVARQNYSCCGNCGRYEIRGEVQQALRSRPVIGYVFYHMQDTESASECGSFYLAYGAVRQGSDSVAAVGHLVVQALERARLRTEWDGNPDNRIRVDIDWKRRRKD